MDRRLFVGREAELAQLQTLLINGAQGQGSLVLIEGEAGSGKSSLLEKMQTQAQQNQPLEKTNFVSVRCDEHTGEQNAYQPFIEILAALTQTERQNRDLAKIALTILKEVGPDWLNMIPGVGAVVSAGIKTATLSGQLLLDTSNEHEVNASTLLSQYVKAILSLAPRYQPLVLVIEDTHWIDESSCSLLLRLARRVRDESLVILLTYRPSHLSASHPLKCLQREIYAQNLAHAIALPGLTNEQIQHYVQTRFKSDISSNLVSWLVHLCNGNPLFISQYLELLQQCEIIRRENDTYVLNGEIGYANGEWALSDNIPIPATIEAILDQRIQRLIETDRQLLQHAAIQGQCFLSTILAEMIAVQELEVLPRLRKLVEDSCLIRYGSGTEEWLAERDDIYTFEHALMHRAFYQQLSPREQVLYHRRVAELLEENLQESPKPFSKLVIQVAYHYDLGKQPKLAADYYLLAAQSSFAKGAFSETVRLCQRALNKVRHFVERTAAADRLRAELIQLLLLASEIKWRGNPDAKSNTPYEQLVGEAEAAALHCGDRALIARIKYLKGHLALVTENFPEALKTMHKALEISREANDPLMEFIILSRLGHETGSQDLTTSLKLLSQARDLYENRLRVSPPAGFNPAMLDRAFHRLQSFIGVSQFDRGHYGDAIQWLTRSVAGLKQLKMGDYLVAPCNFLAQVYVAAGLFEDAEKTLLEALQLLDNQEPNAWNGYNQGLLGKLYLEWDRVEDAIQPLTQGWQEMQATQYVAMLPLVRNYYAELLMHPRYQGQDLQEAERLLRISVQEAKQTGGHRSAIAALSLYGQLWLYRGQIEAAVNCSTRALNYLKKMGMQMPALRTEEILFHHARVLHRAGRRQGAWQCLQQANEIVQQKALTLQSEEHRHAFLNRVPVNQAILAVIENAKKASDRKALDLVGN